MTYRITITILVALIVMGWMGRRAEADSQQVRDLRKQRLTISLRETDIRTALTLVFNGTNVPFVVDADVPNIVVSGELRDRPFHEVIQWLMAKVLDKGAKLQYGFGEDTFFLVPNPNSAEEAKRNLGVKRKVQLKIKELTFRQALDVIFMGSGLQFSLHPSVPNVPVTLDLDGITIEQALAKLVETAQVAVTLEGDVYVVRVAK